VVFLVSPQPFAAALDTMLAREWRDLSQELDTLSLAEFTYIYLQLFGELTGR